jgi:hypothetical protein
MAKKPTEDTPVEPAPPLPESVKVALEMAIRNDVPEEHLLADLQDMLACLERMDAQAARNAAHFLRQALPHVQALAGDTNV